MKPVVDLRTGQINMPEPPFVITTGPLVGLGDHAVLSTLPERLSKYGDVYLDKDCAARNPEIIDVLWDRNPHLKGMTNRKPNCGYVRQGLVYEIANRYRAAGGIAAVEMAHGLPPPYNIAPRVYYEPKAYHLDVREKVVVDFSTVSSTLPFESVNNMLRAMRGRFKNGAMVNLVLPDFAFKNSFGFDGPAIEVTSIYDYLDILSSCQAWVGSEAGGQSLAAAVRGEKDRLDVAARPDLCCLITPMTFNDGLYVYNTTNYWVASTDGKQAFHFPRELGTHEYEMMCAMSLAEMKMRQIGA